MLQYCDNLDDTQTSIMLFVKEWVKNKNTPIPKHQIMLHLTGNNIKEYIVLHALRMLLKKGYIRVGYSEKANRTVYVMTRNI